MAELGILSSLEPGLHFRRLHLGALIGLARPPRRPPTAAGLADLSPNPTGGHRRAARSVLGVAPDRTPPDRGPHRHRRSGGRAARERPTWGAAGGAPGLSQLEGWAAFPNSTFWVLPIGGALVGPSASLIAALTNAVYAAPNAVCIHLMRRDAPFPPAPLDQLARPVDAGGGGVGLLLHLSGPAPAASHWVLVVAGPLLAFVGAAPLHRLGLPPPQRLGGPQPPTTAGAGCSSPASAWPTSGRDRRHHQIDGGGGHRRALGLRAAGLQPAPAGGALRLPVRAGDDRRPMGLALPLPVGH